MAKRVFQSPTWTPTATADATNLTNATYMAIGATNASSGLLVQEIELGGQASSSTVHIMMFARDSTLVATPTALAAPNSDGPMNTLSPAAQVSAITNVAAGTAPQRSNTTTSARLALTFNGFGGIIRWQAAPFEEWGIVGVSTSISESTLSAFTGSGSAAIGSHIIYETYGAG